MSRIISRDVVTNAHSSISDIYNGSVIMSSTQTGDYEVLNPQVNSITSSQEIENLLTNRFDDIPFDVNSYFLGLGSDNMALSSNYSFDASMRTVKVNENDFIKFLSVVNVTRGVVIFDPARELKTGTTIGQTLKLNFDTSSYDDSDILLIAYEKKFVDEHKNISRQILDQMQQQTKFLRKIYTN